MGGVTWIFPRRFNLSAIKWLRLYCKLEANSDGKNIIKEFGEKAKFFNV